jgi:urease accessory protein
MAMLQLCDSLFPLGAFAHSDGLEAAVASGQIASSAELEGWMSALLTATLGDAEGPAVREAMACVRGDDAAGLARLDDEIGAMRPSAAGREATRSMGTRLLKTWHHIRPCETVRAAIARRTHYTGPVAFGIVCATIDVSVEEALEAYFYTRMAAAVSAAMRLIALGQLEAHALLARVLADAPALASRVARGTQPPRSFAPFMDMASMSHQYLHSRLFRS